MVVKTTLMQYYQVTTDKGEKGSDRVNMSPHLVSKDIHIQKGTNFLVVKLQVVFKDVIKC